VLPVKGAPLQCSRELIVICEVNVDRYTRRWCRHLLGCQRKGEEAFERGEPKTSCPYKAANSYETGGKNLTRQRRNYWLLGWELASCAKRPETVD
jgi:hypothetical protein